MRLEQELFTKFTQDFSAEIAANPDAQEISFRDLAGDGGARIGLPGNPGFQRAAGVTGVLQEFNEARTVSHKISILDSWLVDRGFSPIPLYQVNVGAFNRDNILGEFKRNEFDGVLLPCANITRRGCRE